jgi:HEAT repeat protein
MRCMRLARAASALVVFTSLAGLIALATACHSPATKRAEPAASAQSDAKVNSGAEWIAWYRALGTAELHRRVANFESQRPPPVDYLPQIAAALHDRDRDVRALAARGIGSCFQEAAPQLDALKAALADGDEFVRLQAAIAVEAVSGSGEASVDAFAGLLHSNHPTMRATAAGWLAGADETGTNSLEPLRQAFAIEADGAARREEASMIATFSERVPAAAGTLERCLDDADTVVRSWAVIACWKSAGADDDLARRLVACLRDPDPKVRVEVIAALQKQSTALPDCVHEALRACQVCRDAQVRLAALKTLAWPRGTHAKPEWEPMIVAASDPDPEVRTYAALSGQNPPLGVGPPRPVLLPLLARLVADPDVTPDRRFRPVDPDAAVGVEAPVHVVTVGEEIRTDALRSLLSWGEEARPYVDAMVPALNWDYDRFHEASVALFLAAGDVQPFAGPLGNLARRKFEHPDDASNLARVAAAYALDIGAGGKSWSTLREVLSSLEVEVAQGSGWVGGDHSAYRPIADPLKAPLLAMLKDSDSRVRAAALDLLGFVVGGADPAVGETLVAAARDADARVRLVAAAVAAGVDAKDQTGYTHETLVELKDDPDGAVHALVAQALGESQ